MGAACNNPKRWVLTLLVSSTAAQSALDILEGTQLTATDGQDVQDGKFDDGLYHPSASPTTTKNHIESVLEAFSQILSANYPYYTPSTIDVQTLTWPQTLDIFGTTLTANPSPSVPFQTQNTQSLTKPTASATEATTSSKSATTSISTTRKPSSRTSSSVSSTTSSMTSSTAAAPTSSSTSNAIHDRKHGNKDGDRGIAIILGIMISLIAIAIAASIFWLLWRRKRQSGTYFKPARCSVCTTGTTEPLTSDAARSMTVTPWRLEATEPSRSYMAAAASYLNPKTGGNGAGAGAALAAGPSDSAERLPEVVQKPYVRHQVIQIDPVHPVYGRGPTKLQKSNSTLRRGVPELLNVPGPSDHIELPGDDLAAISELDNESPSRRTSTWTTNPFVAAEQEEAPALPLASVAARDAAFFSRHSRQNSRDFPPYADNPAVTTQTASATSSEAGDLLDREAEDSEADIARPVEDPVSSSAASSPPPPESPNWVGFPLSHQERELDANINPFAPKSFSSTRRSPAGIPPALLAGGPERNLRSSPVPFSPRWRRNGHVPSRNPSPSYPASPWAPTPTGDSPLLRDHFNKSSPQLSAGPSPLTPSRSNPSPLLRNRIAEENRYLAEPSVHYPSWSEISGFDFEGTGVNNHNQRQQQHEDGGDGWRPVQDSVSGRYELAQ